MSNSLSFRIMTDHDVTLVEVSGEVDLQTAPELRAVLLGLDGRVVVDLSAVAYLDSSGLSALSEGYRKLESSGGALALRSPQEHVLRVLEITGLGDWIEQ